MDENVIGWNIRKYRKESKLRQKDIANHFGIPVISSLFLPKIRGFRILVALGACSAGFFVQEPVIAQQNGATFAAPLFYFLMSARINSLI